jgi:hypothetical protein
MSRSRRRDVLRGLLVSGHWYRMERTTLAIELRPDGGWYLTADTLSYFNEEIINDWSDQDLGAYLSPDETTDEEVLLEVISFTDGIHFLPNPGECRRLGIGVFPYPESWPMSDRQFPGTRIVDGPLVNGP